MVQFQDGEAKALGITRAKDYLQLCEDENVRLVQTTGSGTQLFAAPDVGYRLTAFFLEVIPVLIQIKTDITSKKNAVNHMQVNDSH